MIIPLMTVPKSLGSATPTRSEASDRRAFRVVPSSKAQAVTVLPGATAQTVSVHSRPATVANSSLKYDIDPWAAQRAASKVSLNVRVSNGDAPGSMLPPGIKGLANDGLGWENELFANQETGAPSHLGALPAGTIAFAAGLALAAWFVLKK